jgi:hypothetical protein
VPFLRPPVFGSPFGRSISKIQISPMRSRLLFPTTFGMGRGSINPLAQLLFARPFYGEKHGMTEFRGRLCRGIGGSVWGGRRAPSWRLLARQFEATLSWSRVPKPNCSHFWL